MMVPVGPEEGVVEEFKKIILIARQSTGSFMTLDLPGFTFHTIFSAR